MVKTASRNIAEVNKCIGSLRGRQRNEKVNLTASRKTERMRK